MHWPTMPSFRLTLAYDGTDFSGSQVQPSSRTVQGELERSLEALAGAPLRTTFGGRTDRGVHAAGQIAAASLPGWRGSCHDLQRALNAKLPRDIVATDVDTCDPAFNPRFDALWREYRYWLAPSIESPFLRRYAWTPGADVDVTAMVVGSRWLVGTHDFASFASGGDGVPWSERAKRPRGTIRQVFRCDCREIAVRSSPGDEQNLRVIEFIVTADAFLPRMVRNFVGALVEVGRGRREAEWVGAVREKRDRRQGSVVAPPQGLTLHKIGY